MCFIYNQIGHRSYRCPEKMGGNNQEGDRRIHLAQEEDAQSDQGVRGNVDLERGESLMFNRTLLKIVVE